MHQTDATGRVASGPTQVIPFDVATDTERFAAYLLGLSPCTFRSRDEVDEAAWASWVGGPRFGPTAIRNWMTSNRLEVGQRTVLVALTWPARLEQPLTVPETMMRDPAQLAGDVTANLASIARRYWQSHRGHPPLVEGHRLELGDALELLGPGWGISPSTVRRLLRLQPVLLAVDELLDLADAIGLAYSSEQPGQGGQRSWPLATAAEVRSGRPAAEEFVARPGAAGVARWWVDDVRLAADVQLETRLLRYRAELAEQLREHRPGRVHEQRIGCYGQPPPPRNRYYALFRWLDEQSQVEHPVPITDLTEIYAGRHRDLARITPRPANPLELPRQALEWPGWWSNPRPGTQGVGSQLQRIAWLAAGFSAKPLLGQDPATGAKRVDAVQFTAVPGRDQWHPFRHRLRAGEGDAGLYGAIARAPAERFAEELKQRGGQVLRWFDLAADEH